MRWIWSLLFIFYAACALRGPQVEVGAEDLKSTHRLVADSYDFKAGSPGLHRLLSRIFTGEALTQYFLSQSRSLRAMSQESTQIIVQDLSYQRVQPVHINGTEVEFDVIFTLTGEVRHRKHQHLRRNQYHARMQLKAVDDGFRIARYEILDMQRLQAPLRSISEHEDAKALSPSQWMQRLDRATP